MKCMFAAVTCILSIDNTSLHIVTESQEKDCKASFVFVFDSLKKQVIASHTEGSFSKEQYMEALELCRDESEYIFQFFKAALLAYSEK